MFNRGTGNDGRPPDLQSLFQQPATPASPASPAIPAKEPAAPLVPQASATIPASPMVSVEAQGNHTSYIGPDLVVMGNKITVISRTRLKVDGEVRGDINGKEIIIGQSGVVAGTVSANAVEVHGRVTGAVKAQNVTLHPTAHVDGDIHNQVLRIAEGAVFDGRVRRARDAAELAPILDPAALAAKTSG